MPRKVFYSFHYEKDSWRTSQVRNIGAIEGNEPAHDNEWEQVKRGGERSIQRWIDEQLNGRSCTIVLIGSETAERKWVKYEIEKSWNDGKGVLGIYIHNLKDQEGKQSPKGQNPFDSFYFQKSQKQMSAIVKTYDPPYSESKSVYNYISSNLANWIETAIEIRENYNDEVYERDYF